MFAELQVENQLGRKYACRVIIYGIIKLKLRRLWVSGCKRGMYESGWG